MLQTVISYNQARPNEKFLGYVDGRYRFQSRIEAPVLLSRDAAFTELGLTASDVQTADQVVAVLAEHPRLMQRPVLVRGDRAIIGRPKDRVAEFLA